MSEFLLFAVLKVDISHVQMQLLQEHALLLGMFKTILGPVV